MSTNRLKSARVKSAGGPKTLINVSPSLTIPKGSKSPYGKARPPTGRTARAYIAHGKSDPEVQLERTLLQVAEMKVQYYADKFTGEGEAQSRCASQRQLSTASRPQTTGSSVRQENTKANSKIMKQLYLKNQQLEAELRSKGLPVNYETVTAVESLQEERKNLAQELVDLEMQLTGFSDNASYIQFLERYVNETLDDTRRIEATYKTTRTKLVQYLDAKINQTGSDVAVRLRTNLDTEMMIRDQEHQIYEEKLSSWSELNRQWFKERDELMEELEKYRSNL